MAVRHGLLGRCTCLDAAKSSTSIATATTRIIPNQR